jgi:hypothetical protein
LTSSAKRRARRAAEKVEDPLKDAVPVASSLPGEVPDELVGPQLPTPTTETEPVPEPAQAPPEPQGPTLEDVLKAILKHQEETDKKLESIRFNSEADHGTLLQHDNILRKVDNTLDKLLPAVQAAQGQSPNTAGGGISLKDIIDVAKSVGLGGGTDPMTALYQEIGQKVMSGTIDSTVKRITKTLGGETASHVVVDSGHG